jgi:hypothetical protein
VKRLVLFPEHHQSLHHGSITGRCQEGIEEKDPEHVEGPSRRCGCFPEYATALVGKLPKAYSSSKQCNQDVAFNARVQGSKDHQCIPLYA